MIGWRQVLMAPLTALLFQVQAELLVWAAHKVLALSTVREAMLYVEED